MDIPAPPADSFRGSTLRAARPIAVLLLTAQLSAGCSSAGATDRAGAPTESASSRAAQAVTPAPSATSAAPATPVTPTTPITPVTPVTPVAPPAPTTPDAAHAPAAPAWQTSPAPKAAPLPAPDAALADGLAQLDELLLQRRDPEVGDELAPGFEAARASFTAACAARAEDSRCRAALATLDALAGWQALADGTTSVGATGRAALQESLLSSLAAVTGTLPQTDAVRAAILFEAERADEAADVVAAAWSSDAGRALAYAPLHAEVRDWRDALPDPMRLVPLLQAKAASGAPTTAASLGYLLLGAGRQREAAGDAVGAAPLFEQGAASFAAATDDPLASEWELATRRADCLVNAGNLHFAAAQAALAQGGVPAAAPALRAAEDDYSGALEALPEDADAARGLELTADVYLTPGPGNPDGDQAGIRELFGRAARRFDRPVWWNNYAFFCRETGQYEESYKAYCRCIELAPDNARWVNDTGLILLYHLDRDLDRAQELFERAWDLGKTACDNPFVSDESRYENFLAYTDAMLNLAQLHGRRGQLVQAQQIIDELLKLSPERSDALALKAEIEKARNSKESPP